MRLIARTCGTAAMLVAVLLVVGCEHGATATSQPGPSNGPARYFFTVPQRLPDGGTSGPQRKALDAWLVRQAGGYTRIGPCQGGWHNGRDLIEEDNIAYFVVGPTGLKPQIERIITERFKQRQAFVVCW